MSNIYRGPAARRRRRRRNSDEATRQRHRDYTLMSGKDRHTDQLSTDTNRPSQQAFKRNASMVTLDLSNDTLNTTVMPLDQAADSPALAENENEQQSNVRVTRVHRDDKPMAVTNTSQQNNDENDDGMPENVSTIGNSANDPNASICSSATTKIIDVSIVNLPQDASNEVSDNNTSIQSARRGSVSVTRTNTREISTTCPSAKSSRKSYGNVNVTKIDRRST